MRSPKSVGFLAGVVLLSLVFAFSVEAGALAECRWQCGDFHSHTWLTDGNYTLEEVVRQGFERYGLDWMANSEHGGTSRYDPRGARFPGPVWRWLTLSFYSYPTVQKLRLKYPKKLIIQGLEWNVPAHEHASVGIVADEPAAISTFEYCFDAADNDTTRAHEGLEKRHTTHQDALAALAWLKDHYPGTSYVILNHPSRKLKYSGADLRDFNNAAPEVAFGFEGLPGHQKEAHRGGYASGPFQDGDGTDLTAKARTYGGADYMVARIGGLWDALLGEGRLFWVFANSDFHQTRSGFWPGEYAKSCTFVRGRDYRALVDSLRSGNSFAVFGDLIRVLDFRATAGSSQATMGQSLTVRKGQPVTFTIRYQSPALNHHGDPVAVDHIDLIAGEIKGKADPGTPEYQKETNETTLVLKRLETRGQKPGKDGWINISFKLASARQPMYFRLRGTNLAPSTPNETDTEGNPLADDLTIPNNAAKAYQDLWFYSNPIFVYVGKKPS
jgi:hypothetical protein